MSEWKQIITDSEISDLLKLFGGFHDSCIKEAYAWCGHFVGSDYAMAVEPWVTIGFSFNARCGTRRP